MPPIRAVLFDYGHTIIDFAAAQDNLLQCYQEVRRLLTAEAEQELPGVAHLIEQISRRVVTMIDESYASGDLQELDIVTLFDTALRTLGVELSRDYARQIAEMEHRALFSGLSASPENLEALRTLHENGLKLGLVSNAALLPDLMHEDIQRLGIARHVDVAVFSSEVGVRKPHPAIFQGVLDALQVAPAESIFVGDRLHDDIGGARRVGMRTVLTREFRAEDVDGATEKPDHVVDRLPDLVPYVLSSYHMRNEEGHEHGQDEDDERGDEDR